MPQLRSRQSLSLPLGNNNGKLSTSLYPPFSEHALGNSHFATRVSLFFQRTSIESLGMYFSI
jgi:hypothetical protein